MGALEREGQSQNKAELRTDGMLALLLGQMREAIEQARPFPAEFDAFIGLARDSDLAAAAQPLAQPARNGVASRAVLVKGLAELAGRMAVAGEPAVKSDWREQTLARLRGLVTIRRIDSSSHTGSAGGAAGGSDGAVGTAQAALARGDLAGAVAALEPLTGADAEAAGPWLLMARERLAAETALDHIQELLTGAPGQLAGCPGCCPGQGSGRAGEGENTVVIRGLLGLLVFAGLITAAVFFADHPGQVEIVWQGWQVETSVGVLAAAAVLASLAIALLFWLVSLILDSPRAFLRRRRERRTARRLPCADSGHGCGCSG